MRMHKARPFMDVEADGAPDGWEGKRNPPVFSEAFLYDAVGKGDARFILGVAQEYEHVLKALGPTAVNSILGVKPRLVQRLGTGERITEWLADAVDEQTAMFEERHPSQVILDDDAAHNVWEILHGEYKRNFNPEESMDKDALRAYHTLTDALGSFEQEARQKEQDRLPEKLEQQQKRREQIDERRKLRNDRQARIKKIVDEHPKETSEDLAYLIDRELTA